MMKLSLLFALAAFFVLVPPVNALETVFDGTILSGQSVTVEDTTYIVYKAVSNREILAESNLGRLFIVNNSCRQHANVRICLDNIHLDTDTRAYKIDIRAISLAPDISISRTLDDSEFEAGDGTVVTVKITNDGGLASNLTYVDEFPGFVEIDWVSGAVKRGNSIVWTSHSLKEESVEFSYKITVNEVIDRRFSSKLSYFDGRQMKTARSDASSIKTSPRLLQELLLGSDSIFTGQSNNFTINLTNRESVTAAANIDVLIDSGLEVTRKPDAFRKISETHYAASVEIRKSPYNRTYNRSQDYFFRFRGVRDGAFNIIVNVDYSTDSFSGRVLPEMKESVKVSNKGVKVRSNLDDVEFESGQARTLRIWLQNLNPALGIRNVAVSIDGGGFVELSDILLGELKPHDHFKIAEKDFYAPVVNSTQGYTIRGNVTYITELGENFSDSFTFTETVAKIDDVTIAKTISAPTLESGEDSVVTVKVNNPRKTDLRNVAVQDNVSSVFSVTGLTRAVLDIGAGEEVAAYTYVIRAPRLGQETVYPINTTASYSDSDAFHNYASPAAYLVSDSKDVTIKPQKFELTATRTVDDTNLRLGNFFDVEYTVKNPSTDTEARNVEIALPLQPEFELADTARTVPLEDLAPGEEVTVSGKVKMRAKKVGTFSLGKASVSYKNQHGEGFKVNTSETSLKVEDRQNSDTFIFVSKSAPGKVNNTDAFEVTLTVENLGPKVTSVLVEDGSFRRDFALQNGSSANFSYAIRIADVGVHSLQPATASYYQGDVRLLAGSGSPVVEIVENPVVSLEKIAPQSVGVSVPFDVSIKVIVLAPGASNVTVYDSVTKKYTSLDAAVNFSYSKRLSSAGAETLTAARATYTYNGELYEVFSNTPRVEAVERSFIAIEKSISPKTAEEGTDVVASITARNEANDEISLVLEDGGELWEMNLAPGESRTVEHTVKASRPDPASASYTYLGEQRSSVSNIPKFSLEGGGDGENEKVIKGEGDGKGLLGSLLGFVASILTWQRG